MKSFRQLREAEESSNQIKKIKISFGDSEAGYDSEWNLGKIETEITLAMGDHSKDLFTLSDDISDFNGIPAKEAQTYKETCLLYTSPSPRDKRQSRMPSSA